MVWVGLHRFQTGLTGHQVSVFAFPHHEYTIPWFGPACTETWPARLSLDPCKALLGEVESPIPLGPQVIEPAGVEVAGVVVSALSIISSGKFLPNPSTTKTVNKAIHNITLNNDCDKFRLIDIP